MDSAVYLVSMETLLLLMDDRTFECSRSDWRIGFGQCGWWGFLVNMGSFTKFLVMLQGDDANTQNPPKTLRRYDN